jgi:ribonuclease P protein component
LRIIMKKTSTLSFFVLCSIVLSSCHSHITQKRESAHEPTASARVQRRPPESASFRAAAQRAASASPSSPIMLAKADRLETSEFSRVMEKGGSFHSPLFIINFLPSPSFKFSPASPKKTFKTAVSRNRTRRRIYAAVREIVSKNRIKPNLVIIVPKKKIDDLDHAALVSTIADLFVKARLTS